MLGEIMITAHHMIDRAGHWYTKYLGPELDIDKITDRDTCNLVYTTSHKTLKEARAYKPSMAKFNQRQSNC